MIKTHQELFEEHYKVFQTKTMLFNELSGNKLEDESLKPLYVSLLREEAMELALSSNIVDRVDGIVDVLFVGEFLVQLCGYENGLLSGNGFKGVGNPVDLELDSRYLLSLICEDNGDIKPLDTIPMQILVETLQYIGVSFHSCALNHGVLLDTVAESNLSKFIPSYAISINEAQEICKNIETMTKYKGVDFSIQNDYYVFRDSNGKVMKSHNFFKEPKIAELV